MQTKKISPLFCRLFTYGSTIERINLLGSDAELIELRQTRNEIVDAFTRKKKFFFDENKFE
jgi:hypothetical protein